MFCRWAVSSVESSSNIQVPWSRLKIYTSVNTPALVCTCGREWRSDIRRLQGKGSCLPKSRLQVNDLQREGNALYEANAVLEQLVSERTAELSQTILQLRQQLAEIDRARKVRRES